MLVLTRKAGEKIVIDNHIVVQVIRIDGNRVRIGIEAPSDVNIRRQELPAVERNAWEVEIVDEPAHVS